MPRTLTVAVALAAVLGGAPRAAAHALGAECRLQGGRVELEAYYDDDTPARAAKVRVEDGARRVVAEGKTDAEGRWSFAQPAPGRYRVLVDAGVGHRKEVDVTIPAAPGDPVATANQPPVTVSAEPTREEFTRFPWLKLGIGLGVIGGVAAAFLLSRRVRRSQAVT